MKFVSMLFMALLSVFSLVSANRGLRSDTCNLEPEPGRCLALFPKYYYSPFHNDCREFVYGGCEGNANNFATKEECERACKI